MWFPDLFCLKPAAEVTAALLDGSSISYALHYALHWKAAVGCCCRPSVGTCSSWHLLPAKQWQLHSGAFYSLPL
jgi:hypothetical protein